MHSVQHPFAVGFIGKICLGTSAALFLKYGVEVKVCIDLVFMWLQVPTSIKI